MAKGKTTGRNHLPRASSPEGIDARQEQRLKAAIPKPGYRRPGSRNRRKAGR